MDANLAKPWHTVQQEVTDLLARVDVEAFKSLLAAFADKRQRWFFSGQGRSGLVAQMAAIRFMQAGYDVHVVGEITAPAIRRGDGLFLVCGSGQTPTSLGFAAIAKAEGAQLVAITHKPQSKLAGMADLLFPIPMQKTVQFGGSVFEQCCIILMDAILLQLTAAQDDAHAGMWHRHTNLQ
jgi:6-phospho-3-hexuloisomerase